MKKIYYKHPSGILPVGRTAMALGLFDGVHIGHRALIADAVRVARERGLIPAVFTFGEGGALKSGTARIYPEAEKLRIFEALGVELCFIADFDSVASLKPDEFVREVIVGRMGAELALAGENFRFGYRAEGRGEDLVRLMRECGGDASIRDIESYDLGDGKKEVSSTRIRELLTLGDVASAARLLGAPYTLSASVLHGKGMGRTYGYPTVNTAIGDESPLRSGVYHTRVEIGEKLYTGLTNIGTCPTFGERERHAETYIIGFSGEIYGEEIRLHLVDFVREERRFADAEELRREISRNIRTVTERDGSEEV